MTLPDRHDPEPATRRSTDPLAVTDDEVDYLTALAEFEIEHRRILAMQALYQRRSRAAGGGRAGL